MRPYDIMVTTGRTSRNREETVKISCRMAKRGTRKIWSQTLAYGLFPKYGTQEQCTLKSSCQKYDSWVRRNAIRKESITAFEQAQCIENHHERQQGAVCCQWKTIGLVRSAFREPKIAHTPRPFRNLGTANQYREPL